ncbi:MAG: hypothetical protein FWC39_13300 [Bacteroidetes bacterium]|nr:hypothetical protein [Bacteroidota bacterium]
MKQSILFVIVALLLTNCNKDAYIRLPAVETVSAEVSGNDVVFRGKILDSGNSGIYTLGFCYQQDTVPQSIIKNQILIKKYYADGTFEAVLSNLKQDSTYYFKAFIITENGSAVGEAVKYTVPRFVAPEAPCASNLTENKIQDVWVEYSQTQNYSVTVSSSISNRFPETYDIELNCGYNQPKITFSFRETPTTGIYNTTAAIEQYSEGKVAVTMFKSNGSVRNYYTIQSAQPVYVNRENDDRIILSFCNLIYTVNGREYSLSGKAVLKE